MSNTRFGFDQAEPRMHPEYTNDVVARVEQLNGGRLSEWTDPYGQIHPGTYPMLLRGDGWRAYSTSTSLYEGTVQLAGSFEADGPGTIPSAAQVAGTTVGRQLITRTSRLESEARHAGGRIDTLGSLREGQTGFRSGPVPVVPVSPDPRGWYSAMVPPRERPWIREVGILVSLAVATPPWAVLRIEIPFGRSNFRDRGDDARLSAC